MTAREALDAVIAASDPIAMAVRSVSVDWGHRRGQGRRSGHMVMGAASDVSLRGLRTYTVATLPDADEPGVAPGQTRQSEFGRLCDREQVDYRRARGYGCEHHESMLYALRRTRKTR